MRKSHSYLKAHRAARELEELIAQGRTREVLALIDQFGLSAGDRTAVARELDRAARVPDADRVELVFDHWDRAGVRQLADVWREPQQVRGLA